MTECYFISSKGTTSATICARCGKEKMLHTIGEGIKASTVIISTDSPKAPEQGGEKELTPMAQLFLALHNTRPNEWGDLINCNKDKFLEAERKMVEDSYEQGYRDGYVVNNRLSSDYFPSKYTQQ